MLHCKLENGSTQTRIVASRLPTIGETIFVETMGCAVVERIFHNPLSLDNYIKVEYQETVMGKLSSEHRFEIRA